MSRGLGLYQIWIFQAYHELTAKYKRTFLGSLWIAGTMITTSLSLAIVFGALFGQSLKEAMPYMMGGILCYTLVSFTINEGVEIFMSNFGIIRNNAYPFSYFVFEGISRSFFTFLHNLVVFYLTLALLGSLTVPHWSILLSLPLSLVTMYFWGTLIGMVSARFRDLRFMLPYIGQLLFFMTPIFWKADQITGPKAIVKNLNPFYGFVEILRQPLLGKAPNMICWEISLITFAIGFLAWLIFYPRFRRRIPFWV